MEFLKLAGIGTLLGVSVLIPGISAGTMAIVFNIYDRLIGVITPNIKKVIAAWKFWLPLAIGVMAAVLTFSKVIAVLYEKHPIQTNWFFIGIIAGSIPMIYRKVISSVEVSSSPPKIKYVPTLPSPQSTICAIIALAVMLVFAVVSPNEELTVYSTVTPALFAILVLGGVLASLAMIIPGISGSFLLLAIGLYRTVLQAVSDLNLMLLLPFVLGVIAGLLAGSAIIRLLLAKAPRATYGAILGLVVGSIVVLYRAPGTGLGTELALSLLTSILCFLGGFAASFFAARKRN